jgi:hypothetical protein
VRVDILQSLDESLFGIVDHCCFDMESDTRTCKCGRKPQRRSAVTPMRMTIPPASSFTQILWPGSSNAFASSAIFGQAALVSGNAIVCSAATTAPSLSTSKSRRLAKDWECLNHMALAFLRLASIRLMLRKLCNPACSGEPANALIAPLIGINKPKPSANIVTPIAKLKITTGVMSHLRLLDMRASRAHQCKSPKPRTSEMIKRVATM